MTDERDEVESTEDEFTEEEALKEAARIYFKLWPYALGEPLGPLMAAIAFLLAELGRPEGWTKEDLHELLDDVYDRGAMLDLEQSATLKGGSA